MENLPSILLEALDELEDKELKKLKFHLSHKMLEGFTPIPKGQLESADSTDITRKLIDVYCPEGAVKIALCILRKMKKNALAEKITSEMQTIDIAEEDLCEPEKRKLRLSEEKAITERELFNESVNRGNKSSETVVDVLLRVKATHKHRLKEKCKYTYEFSKGKTPLNQIYTKVEIIEGERKEVNQEHEFHQMERGHQTTNRPDTIINCSDIFRSVNIKNSEDEEQEIRTVLMKGIAGIGKTVSVQNFILDWAEDKANTDVDFVFMFTLRELNLLNGPSSSSYSLHELLIKFNPELEDLSTEVYDDHKVLFVFDGLDESRFPLDFTSLPMVNHAKTKSTVDVIVVNIIKANLLPFARVWITSRPAAANQIPPKYIDRLTEVQGFNDQQKEEYFRKKIKDQSSASKIVSHIKKTRSLHIMCHIPIFCWISALVLDEILACIQNEDIPKTLTGMYLHFLLIQTTMKNEKYDKTYEKDYKKLLESNRSMILKLAHLAYKQLMKGNIIFYEEDLKECGIDCSSTSVYSGLCTEIFKQESVLHKTKVYCFVHLSIQEFMAALFVFYCFVVKKLHLLNEPMNKLHRRKASLYELLKKAVDEALESTNGHLDLFLRFLLGISLDSNQKLLQGFLPRTESSSKSIKKTIDYVQHKIKSRWDMGVIAQNKFTLAYKHLSPDRSINLFLCLLEMNDVSLYKEIQSYLKSGWNTVELLSPAHCSVIAYMLQMSEDVLDELDLQGFNTTNEGKRRLIPAVRKCKRAKLAGCDLGRSCCESIASALQTNISSLRELDLSDNYHIDKGMKMICEAIKNSKCKLEILRLVRCNFSRKSCKRLATGLHSLSSHLKELDLSNNELQDSGLKLLFSRLKNNRKLVTLRLNQCSLSKGSCKLLASVLTSGSSDLRELDLSNNDLRDDGVKIISAGLQSSHCGLEILKLSGCQITQQGCLYLTEALRSNPSSILRELDLSYNHPGDSGQKLLSDLVNNSLYKLEKLRVDGSGESRMKAGLRKYACKLTLDPNTAYKGILLSQDNKEATGGKEALLYLGDPGRFWSFPSVSCREVLHGRCYWEAEWVLSSFYKAGMAVVCKEMGGKELGDICWLRVDDMSWTVQCGSDIFRGRRDKKICLRRSKFSNRFGVFLDLPNGIMSFYIILSDAHLPAHVYTLTRTFREPLYAGFYVSPGVKVTLCDL